MDLTVYVKCADNPSTQHPDANGVYTIEADGSTDGKNDPARPFDAKLTFSVEVVKP